MLCNKGKKGINLKVNLRNMKTKDTQDNLVRAKELRQNLDEHSAQEDVWETTIDFTKIKKGGVLLTEVRQALSRA